MHRLTAGDAARAELASKLADDIIQNSPTLLRQGKEEAERRAEQERQRAEQERQGKEEAERRAEQAERRIQELEGGKGQ